MSLPAACDETLMISVVIPTFNSEHALPATLSALVPSAVDGFVRQVIVVDGGSRDQTELVADLAGTDFVSAGPRRSAQLTRGAAAARFPWLLFLHPGTVLETGWELSASRFMREVEEGARPPAAGAFTFRIDDRGVAPRLIEQFVRVRTIFSHAAQGDQGLLISRTLFDDVGGYRDLPILEDVDLARRLGRGRMALLDARALASADRYRREGYVSVSLRNQISRAMFGVGIPAGVVARLSGAH